MWNQQETKDIKSDKSQYLQYWEEKTDESMSHRLEYEVTAMGSMTRHGKGLVMPVKTKRKKKNPFPPPLF